MLIWPLERDYFTQIQNTKFFCFQLLIHLKTRSLIWGSTKLFLSAILVNKILFLKKFLRQAVICCIMVLLCVHSHFVFLFFFPFLLKASLKYFYHYTMISLYCILMFFF